MGALHPDGRSRRGGAGPERPQLPARRQTSRNSVLAGFLRLRMRSVALGPGELEETRTLAGVQSLAGVLGALAGRLALAGIHAFALHLAFIGSGSIEGNSREHHGRRGSQGEGGFTGAHWILL